MPKAGFTPTEKKSILQAFIRRFESEMEALLESGKAAREAATHEENKAEDQHDTRGLEASYLAGAQAARAAELKQVILEYRALLEAQTKPSLAVAAGAIARIQALDEDEVPKGPPMLALIAVHGGGTHADWEGERFSILTPGSPLGEAALGAVAGEEVAVESKAGTKLYRVLGVW